MPLPHLRKLEVQGFRSFGTGRQSFDVSDTVTVLWGGNSQGKSSLAEALEFLFTGEIVRRELMASAKDEFADSLRNAHIPAATPVTVEATIECPDGVKRKLRRALVNDFKGNSACTSRIEIDGKPATEADLLKQLGLKLMPAPLRAPVLAQHTLGYIFSAGPGDRATYFRAVLDTQDLEDFRNAVAGLEAALPAPQLPELQALAAVETIPEVAESAKKMRTAKTKTALDKQVARGLEALLTAIGITPNPTRIERATQLEKALEAKRSKTFPVELFGRRPFVPWATPEQKLRDVLATFTRERNAVEAETQRLLALFTAALSIETIKMAHAPIDCPLCATPAAMTLERISHIREQVAANAVYKAAERAVGDGLRALDAGLSSLGQSGGHSLPRFSQSIPAERRALGFTVAKLAALVPDATVLSEWLLAYRRLRRSCAALHAAIRIARDRVKGALNDLANWQEAILLDADLAAITAAATAFETAQSEYGEQVRRLSESLNAAIDRTSSTAAWHELAVFGRNADPLWRGLEMQRQHLGKVKAVQAAVKEIDAANGLVADEKFDDLSRGIKDWWERLRPGEPSFFEAVKRRGTKTRRNIDLKVGLSAHTDRTDPKLRDAIAVFSQSQLHCLGLSLFLARVAEEGAGFVVLDDPVLSSDDDFRPNFEASVIEALLAAGIQVIVLTQDYKSWKNIGHRWDFRGALQLQLVRNDPVIGTEVRNENDQLASMLAKVQPFINSQDPEQRKQGATQLRQAIERFCKELIVRDRQAAGDGLAALTDYDGKNFGDFKTKVEALLTKDPSHRGKLRSAHSYVTPGPHDDQPPSTGELKQAAGDLKALKKAYLD